MDTQGEQVRDAMKGYWDHWVKDAAQSGDYLKVMVSEEDGDKARDIHESDIAEITGLLPQLEGLSVLELASGVGYVICDVVLYIYSWYSKCFNTCITFL